MITYRTAIPGDRLAVVALLNSRKLPTADIPAELPHFLVAERENEIVGCVGLEIYGSDALIRSLVVDHRVQNQGVGNALLTRVMAVGTNQGVHTLHLLTTTARAYFLTKGFHDESRDKSPEQIRA